MQTYDVTLQSPISNSYRCRRAADSLDIDTQKKSTHQLSVNADLQTPYNIGLILGASGSGKTTLAQKIFGENCFQIFIDETKPIIEQFPKEYDYETCAKILCGIGLTQVPCWIRPVNTLSNGQKARAEAALSMCKSDLTILDEWTSVVDRNVGKIMSYSIQKHARREKKRIVLLSCHYDVVEWLNADWIIDCNKQEYQNRRSLWQNYQRKEKIRFDIKEVGRETWKYFSKYHYLSENIPGGLIKLFGLFHDKNQIGFICYANYIPYRNIMKIKGIKMIMHANRIVIHPDYAGIGLGILLTNETAKIIKSQNYKVMCKFSSTPIFYAMSKSNLWKLKVIERIVSKIQRYGKNSICRKNTGVREKVKTYTFEYVG
jgi:ABC-type Mn2+/Zn2+ transport system ATPase subunit